MTLPPALPPILAPLAGGWTLTRRIEDFRAGEVIAGRGRMTFTPADGGLRVAETVVLNLPGRAPVSGTRGGVWRAEAGGIAVYFEDGRFFHTLAGLNGTQEATHLCDPDRYVAAYDFTRWPAWRAVWRVTGPRKDYRMVSDLVPGSGIGQNVRDR